MRSGPSGGLSMTNEVSSIYVFFLNLYSQNHNTYQGQKALLIRLLRRMRRSDIFGKMSTAANVPIPTAHADFPCLRSIPFKILSFPKHMLGLFGGVIVIRRRTNPPG
jgi:hypothetical protein